MKENNEQVKSTDITPLENFNLTLKSTLRSGINLIGLEENSPLLDRYLERFEVRCKKCNEFANEIPVIDEAEGTEELKNAVKRQLKVLKAILELLDFEDDNS